MPQMQVENLPRIFRIPAQPPGMGGAIKERRDLPSAFISGYPTLPLLDKMSPPPLLGYPVPPAEWAATAVSARAGMGFRAFHPGTGPFFSRSAI